MAKGPPKTVTLRPDDYHAEYVGRTDDGRGFFLTAPFIPAEPVGSDTGREFLALYTFDKSGQFLNAMIDDLGPRARLDHQARITRRDQLLASLGKYKRRHIRIALFRIERFGVEFGFIARPPEEKGDEWRVTVEPGDYMCFWAPWSSGDYDT